VTFCTIPRDSAREELVTYAYIRTAEMKLIERKCLTDE